MNKQKINEALIALFLSKNIRDYTILCDTWIKLFERYNIPDEKIIQAIDKLILTEVKYGLQFAHIINLCTNKDNANVQEKINTEWQSILKRCRGHKAEIDSLAERCFMMITDYDKYGYSENEYEKDQWRKKWEELYKAKLETGNYEILPTIDNKDIKKLCEGVLK